MKYPESLTEAIRYFTDEKRCVDFINIMRWGDEQPVCCKCGSLRIGLVKSRPIWQCKEKGCRKQFSIKHGSVMENSNIPLTSWLPAMWLIFNDKNGISSYEVARALKITQKSAWFLLHRIREAMQTNSSGMLKGTVEIDETHVGGKEKFKHRLKDSSLQTWKNRQNKYKKTTVMGMIERGGEFRGKVVDSQRRKDLIPEIKSNIEQGATVYTDDLASYDKLHEVYNHDSINHSTGQYAKGEVHTNTMENFWCLLKRSIKGTYVQVMPFHLDRYVDEQAFRYNHRKNTDLGRFMLGVAQIFGKRLTYEQLIHSLPSVSRT